MQRRTSAALLALGLIFLQAGLPATAREDGGSSAQPTKARKNKKKTSSSNEIDLLKEQLALQQKRAALQEQQIEQLRVSLEEQKKMLERALLAPQSASAETPNLGRVASLSPILPSAGRSVEAGPSLAAAPVPGAAPVTEDEMKGYTKKVDQLEKTLGALNKGLRGLS